MILKVTVKMTHLGSEAPETASRSFLLNACLIPGSFTEEGRLNPFAIRNHVIDTVDPFGLCESYDVSWKYAGMLTP